jgi:hypothetical protein
MFLGSKVRLVRRAGNLTTIWADCLDNVGSLTSHNPIGLQGLLRDSFTLLYVLVFLVDSFPLASHQLPKCIFLIPHSCYTPRWSHLPWLDHSNYTQWREYHKASSYAVVSTFLLPHPSSVQVFSLAPCSQTPLVYVPPLISEIKFHIHTEPKNKIIVLYILIFMLFNSRWEDRRFWTEW